MTAIKQNKNIYSFNKVQNLHNVKVTIHSPAKIAGGEPLSPLLAPLGIAALAARGSLNDRLAGAAGPKDKR